MQILISWLHQKPADLDLHSFLKRMFPGSVGQGLNIGHIIYFSAGILMKAKGLAVITVVKAGFLVTARGGSGIVIAKLDDGIINSGMRGFLVTALEEAAA